MPKIEERFISGKLADEIDQVLTGKYNKDNDVKISEYTPEILVKLGIKNLPMLINQRHLRENIISATKAKKMCIYNKNANYHNLGKQTFMQVMEKLKTPIAVIKSISKNGKENTYIVITEVENQKKEHIIVPIYINARGNYNNKSISANKIKTVYGKENIKNLVDRTIKEDIENLIYITKDKNKRRLITTLGLQLSNQSNKAIINNNITSKN